MSNKTLFGGLAGGLASFLLGWLIFGVLLKDFTAANYNNTIMRGMENMVWWAMILSNLLVGFFIAMVCQWSNTAGFSGGLMKGGIIGFFMAASVDLRMYGLSTMFLNGKAMAVDVIAATIMFAIAGGVVAWVMGMNADKKEA